MQDEKLIIEFMTTAVEAILQLNEPKSSLKGKNIETKFGLQIHEEFGIRKKIPANWEIDKNRNISIEFLLHDKQNSLKVYPLELWSFDQRLQTQTGSSDFDFAENINLDKVSFLTKRLKFTMKSIMALFLSGPSHLYNNMYFTEKNKGKQNKLKGSFMLVHHTTFHEKDRISKNNPKWETSKIISNSVKNSHICLTISHSTASNIIEQPNLLDNTFVHFFLNSDSSNNNIENKKNKDNRGRFYSDKTTRNHSDFFQEKQLCLSSDNGENDKSQSKKRNAGDLPFNLFSKSLNEKNENLRKLSARSNQSYQEEEEVEPRSKNAVLYDELWEYDESYIEYELQDSVELDGSFSLKGLSISTRGGKDKPFLGTDYAPSNSNSSRTFDTSFSNLGKKIAKESSKYIKPPLQTSNKKYKTADLRSSPHNFLKLERGSNQGSKDSLPKINEDKFQTIYKENLNNDKENPNFFNTDSKGKPSHMRGQSDAPFQLLIEDSKKPVVGGKKLSCDLGLINEDGSDPGNQNILFEEAQKKAIKCGLFSISGFNSVENIVNESNRKNISYDPNFYLKVPNDPSINQKEGNESDEFSNENMKAEIHIISEGEKLIDHDNISLWLKQIKKLVL